MAVEMDGMRCDTVYVLAWVWSDGLGGDDDVDVATIVAFWYYGVLGVPRRIAEVEDCGV